MYLYIFVVITSVDVENSVSNKKKVVQNEDDNGVILSQTKEYENILGSCIHWIYGFVRDDRRQRSEC